jgi:hypothetical protein
MRTACQSRKPLKRTHNPRRLNESESRAAICKAERPSGSRRVFLRGKPGERLGARLAKHAAPQGEMLEVAGQNLSAPPD